VFPELVRVLYVVLYSKSFSGEVYEQVLLSLGWFTSPPLLNVFLEKEIQKRDCGLKGVTIVWNNLPLPSAVWVRVFMCKYALFYRSYIRTRLFFVFLWCWVLSCILLFLKTYPTPPAALILRSAVFFCVNPGAWYEEEVISLYLSCRTLIRHPGFFGIHWIPYHEAPRRVFPFF
jgi:hypothetical protein